MGQMYLIFNKALIVSCSNDVHFFRIVDNEEDGTREF